MLLNGNAGVIKCVHEPFKNMELNFPHPIYKEKKILKFNLELVTIIYFYFYILHNK